MTGKSLSSQAHKLPWLRQGEVVIKQGVANLQHFPWAYRGRLYLTNQRLVFVRHLPWAKTRAREDQLDEVRTVEPTWSRILHLIPALPNALHVRYTDGTSARFVCWGKTEWVRAITDQMHRYTKADAPQSPIRVKCQGCGTHLKARQERLGTQAKCPVCKHAVRIEASANATEQRVEVVQAESLDPSSTSKPASDHPVAAGTYDNNLLYPLYYPFMLPGAISRLWWVSLLMFVPVVNLLFLRGWRLELASRVAHREANPLPGPSGIPRHILKGVMLWFFTLTFVLAPFVLIALLGIGGIWDTLGDLATLAMILIGRGEISLWEFAVNEGFETIACMLITTTWACVSGVLYRAGMIRHAVTGNLSDFWNLPASVRLIASQPMAFAQSFFVTAIIWTVLGIVAAPIAATGIGALLVVAILPPMYFWSSGYECGQIGARYAQATQLQSLPSAATRIAA